MYLGGLRSLLRDTRFSRSRLLSHKAPVVWPEEPLDLPTTERSGFYAATVGQILNSRYAVVRKLGWGQHSSVWLARDVVECQPNRYVAVKILSAHATEVQGQLANELPFLQRITNMSRSSGHPGRNHVTMLLDNFRLKDVHGDHLCMVYQAMGDFKSTFQAQSKKLPVECVKNVIKQLLLALDFLHRECRIVHTDIKPDNIVIRLSDVDSVLQHRNGSAPLSANSDKRAHLSQSIIGFNPMQPPPAQFDVQLADFGTAAEIDGWHADLIQPAALRAPEVILGCDWDASADIWNLGCMTFEFLTGAWLFNPRSGPHWTPEAYHLAHMGGVCTDEFDLSHLQKGKHFEQYFTSEGKLRIQASGVRDLDVALRNYNVLDDVERPLCVSFLRSMLRLNPSNRATAAELIEHEWLNR